jgi:hypothetical protein
MDCRFAELHDPGRGWVCAHPTSELTPMPNYVTGVDAPPYQLKCFDARVFDMDGRCGPQGRHWQRRA